VALPQPQAKSDRRIYCTVPAQIRRQEGHGRPGASGSTSLANLVE
jgi:hypothetical protein